MLEYRLGRESALPCRSESALPCRLGAEIRTAGKFCIPISKRTHFRKTVIPVLFQLRSTDQAGSRRASESVELSRFAAAWVCACRIAGNVLRIQAHQQVVELTLCTYQNGRSEQLVGEVLKGRRDQVVLSTKVGEPLGEGPNDRGLSRDHILR